MLEKDIPDLNLFMMCTQVNRGAFAPVPAGYSIRTLRKGELEQWKAFPFDTVEGDTTAYTDTMTEYFQNVYAPQEEEFFRRCLVLCDAEDRPLGTCFAWKAYGEVWTIHWFKVYKHSEGRGLGRALLTAVMQTIPDDGYPVYLHTQPGSFRAIGLYTDFGFSLLTDDAVGHRANGLQESLPYLQHFMGERFQTLRFEQSDGSFSEIAARSAISEF